MKTLRKRAAIWLHDRVVKPVVKYVKYLFRSRQQRQLEKLLVGVPEKLRRTYEVILNNQLAYVDFEMTSQSNDLKFTLQVIRKALDRLLPVLSQLVGVQPMEGPVALVYLLQYKTNEGRMMLEVVSKAVEAGSRSLLAQYTPEALCDLQTQHGIDIHDMLVDALSNELADEVFAEVLNELRSLNEVPTLKIESDHLHIGSWIALSINDTANEIAYATKRGAGNFAIVSPVVLSLLQADPHVRFVPNPDMKFAGPSSIIFAGTLNETIKIFSSLGVEENEVLVGYKGGASQTDTGFVYSPYIMMMSRGVVVDPLTFAPVVKLMKRYGKTHNDKSASYYKSFKIEGLTG